MMSYTFPKTEKLKSKKLIEKLFSEGQSISAFPLKLIFVPSEFTENVVVKTGVSVSKRNFKKAVDRNRIKRLLREAYRLNKSDYFNNITTQYAFMILYLGKDMPEFVHVDNKMKRLLEKFLDSISQS